MDGEHSGWIKVSMGVPQGFILGLVLFLLFVSNIVEEFNLYADNTTLSSDADPTVLGARVDKDLEKEVTTWIDANGLKINVMKIQLMVLTRKGEHNEADGVKVKIGDINLAKRIVLPFLE